MSDEERDKSIATLTESLDFQITVILDAIEAAARGSESGSVVFQLGIASGYLRASLALVESAQQSLSNAGRQLHPPPPSAAAAKTHEN